MADNVIEQPQIEAPVDQQVDLQAQLKEQMEFSLNIGAPLPQQEEQIQQQVNQPGDNVPHGTNEVNIAPQTDTEPFSVLKSKFQYNSVDEVVKEIEDHRAFRANPKYAEYTVPDDESGKILKALAAGKREEVWQILDKEIRVERLLNSDITNETAAEIVKMGMQLKYQDLTPQEINYRFNKQFGFPAEPKQQIDEDEAEFGMRHSAWKEQVADKQMELMIEAKLSRPELQNSKSNFVFPEIESPSDEGYIQYKKMLEQNALSEQEEVKLSQEISAAYKAMTPAQIGSKINFKDEANKIDFQFQFEPNAEKFAKAVELACDQNQFWNLFKKPDGTPDRERFLDMVYYVLDKDNYLMAAMNQTKNATIKAGLPDNSRNDRLAPTMQEPSELDQLMRNSLRGHGGY